jgi:hypothetical protein
MRLTLLFGANNLSVELHRSIFIDKKQLKFIHYSLAEFKCFAIAAVYELFFERGFSYAESWPTFRPFDYYQCCIDIWWTPVLAFISLGLVLLMTMFVFAYLPGEAINDM